MKKVNLLIPIVTIFLIILLNYKRIQFEYYTWKLSSEDYYERIEYADKIIEMKEYAVPLLIKKINNVFIFETE